MEPLVVSIKAIVSTGVHPAIVNTEGHQAIVSIVGHQVIKHLDILVNFAMQ